MIARRWALRLGILGAGVAVGVSGGTTVAAWTSKVDTPAGTVQAIADWVAPPITDARVVKAQGGTPGFIRPGSGYHSCATLGPDSGNPATGLATFTNDLSALGAGVLGTIGGLVTGSPCPAGTNRDSGLRTLAAGATVGTRSVTWASSDVKGNTASRTASVVVDNTAPRVGVDGFSTANVAGGTAGRPETGDTLRFAFTEPIDPHSLVAQWTGASPATVRVEFVQQGGNDAVLIKRPGGATIPLTSAAGVALGGSYVSANVFFEATMAAVGDDIRVTLGALPASATNLASSVTGPGSTTATQWQTGTAMYDRAGVPHAQVNVTEPAPADLEF